MLNSCVTFTASSLHPRFLSGWTDLILLRYISFIFLQSFLSFFFISVASSVIACLTLISFNWQLVLLTIGSVDDGVFSDDVSSDDVSSDDEDDVSSDVDDGTSDVDDGTSDVDDGTSDDGTSDVDDDDDDHNDDDGGDDDDVSGDDDDVSGDDDDVSGDDDDVSGDDDWTMDDGVSGACCIIVSAVDTAGIIVFILSSLI